jgi:RimJ/RimL family protein N-acetyltransferase
MDFQENFLREVKLKNGKILIIRRPNIEDASSMVEYLNIVGGESDNLLFGKNEFRLTVEEEKEYIQNINKDNTSIMMLGVVDNKIVSVGQISSSKRKRIAHNSELAISVKREYWSLGIGNAVIAQLIEFAKSTDVIKNISLGVRDGNTNAIRLYEKHGFKKVGIHKDFFNIEGKYYDEILMDLYI